MYLRCDTENLYIWKIQGLSWSIEKNIGDGKDRMFSGIDTGKCINFIKSLVHENHILLCEGITSVLCNVSILTQIRDLGYNLHLIEQITPLEECINNLNKR